MNEPSQEVAATLEWLRATAQDGIDKAGPFLSEQTPLYVEELIRWQITLGVALPLLLLVWSAFWITLSIFGFTKSQTTDDIFKAIGEVSAFSAIIGGGGLLTAASINSYLALQAWLAPRVFIANHFADMIQGG